MAHASLAMEGVVMPAFKAHHHKPSAHTLQLIKATGLGSELTTERYILICDSQDSRKLSKVWLSSDSFPGDEFQDSLSRCLQKLAIDSSMRNLIFLEHNLRQWWASRLASQQDRHSEVTVIEISRWSSYHMLD